MEKKMLITNVNDLEKNLAHKNGKKRWSFFVKRPQVHFFIFCGQSHLWLKSSAFFESKWSLVMTTVGNIILCICGVLFSFPKRDDPLNEKTGIFLKWCLLFSFLWQEASKRWSEKIAHSNYYNMALIYSWSLFRKAQKGVLRNRSCCLAKKKYCTPNNHLSEKFCKPGSNSYI